MASGRVPASTSQMAVSLAYSSTHHSASLPCLSFPLFLHESECLRALSHPAGELVHVEIVAPGADLAVTDLEGPHDRQLERLAGELEGVHPLGHHDRTACCDVDDAEVESLDAWRARADKRREVVRDRRPAADRRQRDIVVDGVVREKCGQLGGPDIGVPRRAEPAHYFDWALHLFQTSGLDDPVRKATAMPSPSAGAAGTWRFGLRQPIGNCQVIGVPYI